MKLTTIRLQVSYSVQISSIQFKLKGTYNSNYKESDTSFSEIEPQTGDIVMLKAIATINK